MQWWLLRCNEDGGGAQAQGKEWSQLVQGVRCGKMVDTESPCAASILSLCSNNAVRCGQNFPEDPWFGVSVGLSIRLSFFFWKVGKDREPISKQRSKEKQSVNPAPHALSALPPFFSSNPGADGSVLACASLPQTHFLCRHHLIWDFVGLPCQRHLQARVLELEQAVTGTVTSE